MYKKLIYFIPVLTIILFLAPALYSCGPSPSTSNGNATDNTNGNTTNAISLKNDIQPIFSSHCVVCHQGTSPPVGLSLEPSAVFQNLVNATSTQSSLKRVLPNAPDESYLINKLRGTQVQVGGSGAQMPFNSQPLTAAQIDLIEKWITEGAANN
jgi:mono/diheme cytochrome c family protein